MTQPPPPHDHHAEPSDLRDVSVQDAPLQDASVRSLSWGQRAFLAPLHLYRRFLSPLKPQPTCRFYPSCSQYAVQAVEHHGVMRGSWLALVRLLKCHPFHPGGVDLVPGTLAPQATALQTAVPKTAVPKTAVPNVSASTPDMSAPPSSAPSDPQQTHHETPVRGATPTEES